jgi:hypothetical protein
MRIEDNSLKTMAVLGNGSDVVTDGLPPGLQPKWRQNSWVYLALTIRPGRPLQPKPSSEFNRKNRNAADFVRAYIGLI